MSQLANSIVDFFSLMEQGVLVASTPVSLPNALSEFESNSTYSDRYLLDLEYLVAKLESQPESSTVDSPLSSSCENSINIHQAASAPTQSSTINVPNMPGFDNSTDLDCFITEFESQPESSTVDSPLSSSCENSISIHQAASAPTQSSTINVPNMPGFDNSTDLDCFITEFESQPESSTVDSPLSNSCENSINVHQAASALMASVMSEQQQTSAVNRSYDGLMQIQVASNCQQYTTSAFPQSTHTLNFNGHRYAITSTILVSYLGPHEEQQQQQQQYVSTQYGQTIAENNNQDKVWSKSNIGHLLAQEETTISQHLTPPSVVTSKSTNDLETKKIKFIKLLDSQCWMPQPKTLAKNEQLVENLDKAEHFWAELFKNKSNLVNEYKLFLDELRDTKFRKENEDKLKKIQVIDYQKEAENYLRELERISGHIVDVECTRQKTGTITVHLGADCSELELGHDGRNLFIRKINKIKNIKYLLKNNKKVATSREAGPKSKKVKLSETL